MTLEQVERLLKESVPAKQNDGPALLEHIVDLYTQHRIDQTNLDQDGDMLLFQWGTYDWGEGPFFEIDLTRQTMLDLEDPDEAADSLRQLKVTLRYRPNAENEALDAGEQWCTTPTTDHIAEFLAIVRSGAVFDWCRRHKAERLSIELEHVN